MLKQFLGGLVRSPVVVGAVIGSLVFGVFSLRAEGRVAVSPPTVVISEAPVPDFDPEEATRQVLSLGFGLQYRPGEMGLALEGPPEQGVLDLLVVDQASPSAPLAVATFLNPHAFLLPGMGNGFELPGMDDAASEPARQAGMALQFSIMAGMVVTPQWTGAVCVLAVECATPAPQGGMEFVTAISPFAVAGDLFAAIRVAQRVADLLNGDVSDAAWRESGGPVLSQSQQSCIDGCLAVYNASMRLAATELAQDKNECAGYLVALMAAAAIGCLAAGAFYTPCYAAALAIAVFIVNRCLKRAFDVYYAKVALAKATLNACLAACGVAIIYAED